MLEEKENISGQNTRPKLKASVSTFGFFSLAFGSMIGVGWVTALGGWLQSAGPVGAVLAFLLGGLLMICIGLCYAEVTPMLPVAGGEVAYSYKSFGVGESFGVGWFLAFGYLSVSAFEAISVSKVLGYLFPNQIPSIPIYSIGGESVDLVHLVLALGFTALITYVNYTGSKGAVNLQTYLTLALLAISIVFISFGFYEGKLSNLQPYFGQVDDLSISAGVLAVAITVPFWFVGFDTIPQSAEEANSDIAPKMLGTLIVAAIGGAIIFYALIILSASMVQPWETLLGKELATAAAFEGAFGSTFWAKMVLVAALIGLMTSWNGFFLAGSRVLFALGRGRILSPALGKTHPKYGSPSNAVLISGIFTGLACLLGRQAMTAFVNVGSLCIVIAFLGVSFSFLRLRIKYPNFYRPVRLKWGWLIGIISIIGSIFILGVMIIPASPSSLSSMEWIIFVIVAATGLLFWFMSASSRAGTSKEERDYLILEKYAKEAPQD